MGQCGVRWTRAELIEIKDYVIRMVRDKRVIRIDDGSIYSVIFFSICTDYEPYVKSRAWEYLEHDPEGNILYVEWAVSKKWTMNIRRLLQELILKKYPNIQMAKWQRNNREVTWRRKVYV